MNCEVSVSVVLVPNCVVFYHFCITMFDYFCVGNEVVTIIIVV